MKLTSYLILIGLFASSIGLGIVSAGEVTSDKKQAVQPVMPTKCDANEYELAQCLARERIDEEARYEAMRARVRAALRGAQVQAFDDLEVEWTKYRQASCTFDSARAGGSSQSTRAGKCLLTYTQHRLRTLTKYLACITTGECGNGVGLYMIELDTLPIAK
jgi:uncharacterized protein YecT (DUF1311 family)